MNFHAKALAKPDLFLVDLHLGGMENGFTLIKFIRNYLGSGIPIIVISSRSDPNAVSHALEIGADDFIVKPLDRRILAAKLSRYIKTEELLMSKPNVFPIPDEGSQAEVELNCKIIEVDEFGLRISSKHVLSKGMSFTLESKLLCEMTSSDKPILFTVLTSWYDYDNDYFGCTVEFDNSNEEVSVSVRKWLSLQKNKTIK